MPKTPTYDVIVIGSGSAGFSAAEAARKVGASVCVIENDRLGGDCPNYACVPSKALLKTASVYRLANRAREYGVSVGSVSYNYDLVMKYRENVVKSITGGGTFGARYEKIFRSLGISVKIGKARFLDEHTIEVKGENLIGKTFVIATGSVEFVPSISGIETLKYLIWKDALSLKRQPKSLGIIGGGPVGCELATFFSSFGTRVVLIQSAPQVLHREDAEIAGLARKALESLGVEVITNANVVEVINGGGGVYGVHVDVSGNKTMHAVEQVVLAAGNRANTSDLGLEKLDMRLGTRGTIITTNEQRTSVPYIFAAGDVCGGMQFTHTSHHEGYIAGHNAALLAKKKRASRMKIDERVVPRVTFLSTEVASVGMTQKEAKDAFGKVLVGRYPFSALGRTATEYGSEGLIKIIAHPKTRKIFGGHIIGERAGEIVHEIALAIYLNTTIDKLASMIHAFPSYSESVTAAASSSKLES
ncbi:NAD(P)/FAD-dependent oxidoreductase [Candidatus Uhrbacteria bacterium]|nr:NAD(P)/FAD-dependent oxidoreductase [Candidatus Uhrbacteria bacterium]